MKMRTIKLTSELLIQALQGKASTASNLPDNLELLDIKYDLASKQALAIVRSDSFEDIPETLPIPEFKITYKATLKTQPQPVPVAKIEVKPTVKTMVHPQPNQDTGRLEEEFTLEQRKLLRFTVDGEFVIVKPIQFLKTEWEDINDTVKSIGGQWVKGDIINYWIIPLPQR
jgi:hypothetical protein